MRVKDKNGVWHEITAVNVGGADMLASVYADSPGVVKDSAKLGGQLPAHYAKASDIPAVPTQLAQLSDDETHRLVTDVEKSEWSAKQDPIAASGILKGNGAGGVSAATAGTDYGAPPTVLSKTLTAAGWSSNQQTISDAAIYSASAPGDVRIAQSASDAQFEAWSKAQPRVISQTIGSITLKITGDVPTVDIPVIVEVR